VTARYRAPAGDGALLAQPPLSELGSQLDANADRLNVSTARLGGIPLAEFRSLAVAEILEAASRYLAEPEAGGGGGGGGAPGRPRLRAPSYAGREPTRRSHPDAAQHTPGRHRPAPHR
jgi:hypothetical protein